MRWRKPLAGILIFFMILVTILDGFSLLSSFQRPLWIAGMAGWASAFLLVADTPGILRIQLGVIIGVGLGLGMYAMSLGGTVDPDSIIAGNTGLLSMIAAVGFLRLVALPVTETSEHLPVGPRAYLQTLVGLNLSSAIINISAPILIGDRIHRKRPLQRFTSQSMTRVFCGAASWSPFFGAMAVVLTNLVDAKLSWIILAGLPFTIIGVLVVYIEAKLRYRDEMEEFVGYPMHAGALGIPLLLLVSVALARWLLPTVPVLVIISVCALAITLAVLSIRGNPLSSLTQTGGYITEGLPRIVNELTLFLSAGLIAAGMSAMIKLGVVPVPFDTFDAGIASRVLGIMLLSAALGIHPVILISSFTPMLLTLDPDPNLLAITYLLAWNLGTGSSPLSGTHLVFQGRYDIPSWKGATWNWPYAAFMYAVAVPWLHIIEALTIPQA